MFSDCFLIWKSKIIHSSIIAFKNEIHAATITNFSEKYK